MYLWTLVYETKVSDRRAGRWIFAFAGSARMTGNYGKGPEYKRYKEKVFNVCVHLHTYKRSIQILLDLRMIMKNQNSS